MSEISSNIDKINWVSLKTWFKIFILIDFNNHFNYKEIVDIVQAFNSDKSVNLKKSSNYCRELTGLLSICQETKIIYQAKLIVKSELLVMPEYHFYNTELIMVTNKII